jgi:putative salt-induced outer membrane protein YdiY
LSLAAWLPQPAIARAAKDLLVMKNGDRITCEVKSLDAGALRVNLDYVDGAISIDWLKVARLESDYLFIITLQDGAIYSAKLVTPDTIGPVAKMEIQLESGESPRVVDRSTVVHITRTSDEFFQRFSGNISIGATYAKGNNAAQYNLGSELFYQRSRWGADLRYNSNLSSNTGADTSTRNQLDFGMNRMLTRTHYFLGGISTFLQSSVQGIDRQVSIGVGLGRYFKNTNRFRFWVLGGGGGQKTTYAATVAGQSAQNVSMGVVSTNLQAFVFKKTRFDLATTVFPALGSQRGRIYYRTNASYYIKLFGKVDWNLSFYGSWDTHPPPTFSGSDYGSSMGLSWTFGAK